MIVCSRPRLSQKGVLFFVARIGLEIPLVRNVALSDEYFLLLGFGMLMQHDLNDDDGVIVVMLVEDE